MGCHSGVYAKGGKDLKAKSPNMPDGYGCIRNDDGKSQMFWFDMTTDGGGWAVIAEQSVYESHGYPLNVISKGKYDELPDGNRSSVKSVRLTTMPKYTEYAIANRVDLNGVVNDGSLTEGIWKNDTGAFGDVEVDMMGFLLDKTNYQGGKASDEFVKFGDVAWGDSQSHASYYGYMWFGKNSVTYNWWGQGDMWGHLINSDLFRVASDQTGYGRTAGCGSGWANNACRTGKVNWVHRNTVKHKAVFMVRR
jgi:hypothetical protein